MANLLLDIKTQAATLLNKTVSDLTVNGQDLGLIALNHARKRADLTFDFEFSRQLVTVAVNGVTGGDLTGAVLYSDGTTVVDIKSVIEVGMFDADLNLIPVVWTTVAEGLERQRKDNRRTTPRYPTDAWYSSNPQGLGRFQFTGSSVFRFPKDSTNNFTLGMEVYAMQADWTTGNLSGNFTDTWTKHGSEYLLWQTIVELNTRFKVFVPRTEGNLPPPSDLAAQALNAFIEWDANKFEQFRRHSR